MYQCDNDSNAPGAEPGSRRACLYSKVLIAPSHQAYIQVILLDVIIHVYVIFFPVLQHCEGPGVPYTVVVSLGDGAVLAELDSNTRLQAAVARTALPQHRFLALPLRRVSSPRVPGAPRARLHVLLPPGYRPEDKIAFPTLVTT